MQTSLSTLGILAAVTVFYAGYNVFIKVSGSHVPTEATSALLATICLQVTALVVSLLFLLLLTVQGGHSFQLTASAYIWASVAGICIGCAEIGYFYLFSGLGSVSPMPASVVIPVIVSGTIVIAMVFSVVALKESLNIKQVLGSLLMISGVVLFFFTDKGSAGL